MDSGYSIEKSTSIISLDELLETAPCNKIIGDNLIRAWSIINSPKYERICCSISGGSDSDIMMDICTKVDIHKKITYVFFNTGLEYSATKEHIKFLEQKYHVEIKTYEAWKYGMTIPSSCKKYGQPFINKEVSEFMQRLQRHNFKWEDKPFDKLYKEYPRCKSALKWWCNMKTPSHNIEKNKWLKEFLIENPPKYRISNTCCRKAKKDIAHKILNIGKYDLNIVGVRKAEGGVRASAYKNCYSNNEKDIDEYRPVFWYKNEDKRCYEQNYSIVNSKCYTEYGLKRTGCCGCPFGKDFEYELEVLEKYEPNLYTAVCNVFKDSYEYTRQYKEFCKEMDRKKKGYYQMSILDL